MISLSDTDTGLRDGRGRPLYGRALQVAQAGERRRQVEAEALATSQAVARALVKLLARGALSGPDALRNLVGPGDALRILRAAGMNAEPAAASWQAAAPVQQAQSTGRTAALWASSPDHDPRMIAALTRPGVTDAEIAAVRETLAGEYRARAAQRTARRNSGVMWRTRTGELVTDGSAAVPGASMGPGGAPQQRSVVHADVPEPGSEG